MELDDVVLYQDDSGNSTMMSERVSGLASSIYREFERLIERYGEDVVKELMPLVVAVLENLDSVFAVNQEQEVELELLKEDNEQLVTQYEREKALRKHTEERYIVLEDSQDGEKKDLQSRLVMLEAHSRQLERKTKNYADQIIRCDEREADLKKEYNTLHQRHTEMIHSYMEHLERTKHQHAVAHEPSDTGTSARTRCQEPISCSLRRGIRIKLPQHPKERVRQGRRGGGCHRVRVGERQSVPDCADGSCVVSQQRIGRRKETLLEEDIVLQCTEPTALLQTPSQKDTAYLTSTVDVLSGQCPTSQAEFGASVTHLICHHRLNLLVPVEALGHDLGGAMSPGRMLLFVFGFVGGAVVINSAVLVSLSVLLLVHYSVSTGGLPALPSLPSLPRVSRKELPISMSIFQLPVTDGVTPELHKEPVETPSEPWRFNNLSHPRSNTSLQGRVERTECLHIVAVGDHVAGKAIMNINDCLIGCYYTSSTGVSMESEEVSDGLNKNLDGSRGKPESSKNIAAVQEGQQGQPGHDASTPLKADDGAENVEKSEVQAIIESTPELDMGLEGCIGTSTPTKGGIENLAFDRNTDSLFEELSSAGNDMIADMDEGADMLGMGREVEHLIHENTQLLETKNALNVVKNDLIAQMDDLTCEKEVLRGELEAVTQAKTKLEDKNKELEEEIKKIRAELEESKQKVKNDNEEDQSDVPTAQRKRFTRVEMARVLMERNQYKERLMELQEAVRWTEMIRASKDNPALPEKKKSNLWQFFSRLFSSSGPAAKRPASESPVNVKYNAPTSQIQPSVKKRSITLQQLPSDKSKAFDFLNEEVAAGNVVSRREQKRAQYQQVKAHVQKEDGRVQAYGWSLPKKYKANGGQVESKMKNLPVPVFLRPVDEKDASMK
ncbi:hypothetical protein JOQ06_016508, partial [Pogonophryne albipinna]